jgi:hypothetical protein
MKLWLRLGDNDDYNEFGEDFSALRDWLLECRIDFDEINPIRGGFTTPIFDAENYVSLYWGDDDADFERDLNKDEWNNLIGKE